MRPLPGSMHKWLHDLHIFQIEDRREWNHDMAMEYAESSEQDALCEHIFLVGAI